MEGETPEQQWNRLQREFLIEVQEAHPNPERAGCPDSKVLRELAARSVRFESIEDDPDWKHAVHCGPCYREYINFRDGEYQSKAAAGGE